MSAGAEMIIRRSIFFLTLALLIILPVLTVKLIWIAGTKTTTGIKAFEGMGNALDQLRATYSVIYFKHGQDTVWFNSPTDLSYRPGDLVPVRYRIADPSDARMNTLTGIWVGSLIYGSIPLILILLIFLHPQIVPRRSRISLSGKKPFIALLN